MQAVGKRWWWGSGGCGEVVAVGKCNQWGKGGSGEIEAVRKWKRDLFVLFCIIYSVQLPKQS